MTNEEYRAKKSELTKEYNAKVEALNKAYGKDLIEKYGLKVGDIISDGSSTIKISTFDIYTRMSGLPYFYCYGVWVTKKGTENVRGEKMAIYPEGITTLNGKPYTQPE